MSNSFAPGPNNWGQKRKRSTCAKWDGTVATAYRLGLGGPAPEEGRLAEHLVEREDDGHGQRHLRPGLHHQAEHVRAHRLLGPHLRHGPPPLVVHRAAPAQVRPLHLVPAAGPLAARGAGARRDVRHGLAAAAAAAHVLRRPLHCVERRQARLLAGVHQPLVGPQADHLPAADGEHGAAGSVHEHDLGAGVGGVAVHAVHEVAAGVEHRESPAVEQQRLAPHRQRDRPLVGRRRRRLAEARRGHVRVHLRRHASIWMQTGGSRFKNGGSGRRRKRQLGR
ncbi:hypothetical protein GQ55_3G227300 [Panicum hallii var. hallii]|uniref:Uncharacterized protein n=1 Tax=Panicum hallii var. hallii TaxID=1504633 RepID=A0A2T7ECD3_9POAL|nr:hypothetical protein GQ55_3G227300 [Panicum hallii var. hallii]